jgi:Raf kinase inhibitor-like YbhB/YbcL family protein
MELTSAAFENNGAIPTKYTCQGEGLSPELTIKEVPSAAKALALTVDDPDAPHGTFDHWVVYNFAPTTATIAEGAAPAGGTEGVNGTGKPGYMGPCPPSGVHHYHFKLYALDGPVGLEAGASKEELLSAMRGHIVAQTELIGTYEKH